VDETLVCDHSNESFEQYFHVVLFIMLYKVVLTYKSVDKTLVCDHSNESYRAVVSLGTVRFSGFLGMKILETCSICTLALI